MLLPARAAGRPRHNGRQASRPALSLPFACLPAPPALLTSPAFAPGPPAWPARWLGLRVGRTPGGSPEDDRSAARRSTADRRSRTRSGRRHDRRKSKEPKTRPVRERATVRRALVRRSLPFLDKPLFLFAPVGSQPSREGGGSVDQLSARARTFARQTARDASARSGMICVRR